MRRRIGFGFNTIGAFVLSRVGYEEWGCGFGVGLIVEDGISDDGYLDGHVGLRGEQREGLEEGDVGGNGEDG